MLGKVFVIYKGKEPGFIREFRKRAAAEEYINSALPKLLPGVNKEDYTIRQRTNKAMSKVFIGYDDLGTSSLLFRTRKEATEYMKRFRFCSDNFEVKEYRLVTAK